MRVPNPSPPCLMLTRKPRLSGNVTYTECALIEPSSVVMRGIRSIALTLGRSVVVCGTGSIGLLSLAPAHACGTNPIVVTNLEPCRRDAPSRRNQSSRVSDTRSIRLSTHEVIQLVSDDSSATRNTLLLALCWNVREQTIVSAQWLIRHVGGGTVMVVGVGEATMNKLPFMHASFVGGGRSSSKHISFI